MLSDFRRWLAQRDLRSRLLAAAAALLAAVTLTITVFDDNNDGRPDRVTVTVNAEPGDGAPTTTIEVPKKALDDAAVALEDRKLKDPPPATPPKVLEKVKDAVQKNKATTKALPTAGATQGVPGCVTRFVVNQSSRGGVRPTQHWLHYTVSSNRPGWSDVNAIVGLFNRPSFQASSNFVIDAEGNCAYIVPIENKSWTQAGANRFAVSYEIIATGAEKTYLGSAGYAKLRSVMKTVSSRTGIPLKRGAVSNCVPTRGGIVQHKDGGLCSGGHHDIAPFSVDAVIGKLAFNQPAPIAARWHSRCRRYVATRAKIRLGQHVSTVERRKAHELRVILVKGGYRCSGGRAVRK